MNYLYVYKTPAAFDDLYLCSDGTALTAAVFKSSADMLKIPKDLNCGHAEFFADAVRWFDMYFGGKIPDFTPRYRINILTPFRESVHGIIKNIPYGKTVTYGDIAKQIANERGIERMSAQAVGGAVGSNPVCVIVPCHRVLGTDGSLTGYGGGIRNKKALLDLEGIVYK